MKSILKTAAIAALWTLLSASAPAQSPYPPVCPPSGCSSGGH